MTTIDALNPPDVLASFRGNARKRGRRNKYGSQKCTADGLKFDSLVERERYFYLRALHQAGAITDLRPHPTYTLLPKRKLPGGGTDRAVKFTPDFEYRQDGQRIVEDVKGQKPTADFTVRRKWFQSLHPNAEFRIVRQGRRGSWDMEIYPGAECQ